MHKIPFFDYPRVYLDDRDEILKIIDDVGTRGAFIMQKDLYEFEKNLSKYTGSEYAIGVANATDGLELAWMSQNLKKGDEVICCSHTMLATASAIKTAGGEPIPVELGDDFMIDVNAIEPAINKRTVGLMPTQLNGRTCNMDIIMSIAKKYNLKVIEDAAQALGSKYKGKYAGTFGDASAISFFPAKVLGSLGDAGAVLTSNKEIFHKIYQLHDHGRDVDGEVKCWGRNSRLDNIQAAILNYRMTKYDKVIKRRREVARLYNNDLIDIEELTLPPSPDSNPDHFDVFQNYELCAENRDSLAEHLSHRGIGTLIQWGGKGVHQFHSLGFKQVLPKVENFFNSCIMLPMNTFITNEEIKLITSEIKYFYAKK